MTATMRSLAGLVLLALGVGLLIMAAISLRQSAGTSGDATAVETALRPSPSTGHAEDRPRMNSVAPSAPTTTIPSQDRAGADGENPSGEVSRAIEPDPVGLRIDALDVDAPVLPYGVDSRGQMDVPDNTTDVAWYEHGPRPGDSGSAVLAAHVDLEGQGPGVFFDLRTLEEGDRVTVINDDGTEDAFRVLARVVYDKGNLPLDVIFSRQGPPVLTLITCGGDFNPRVRGYDSNVVVYAVPVGGEQTVPGSRL